MTQHAIWILGWVTLAPVGVFAIGTIVSMIAPQWQRIWSLASGNPEPFFGASVASPAPRRPQLRVVEADAELTGHTS